MPRIGIFKDPRSRYFQAGWRDAAGEHHQQSTGCRDPGAARLWLAAREVERVKEQAGIPTARPASLNLASAEYVAERETTWSKGWRDTVEAFFRNQVLPHFGEDRLVATVTRADVERFRSQATLRLVRGGQPVSPATVNRMMAALAAFGEWCLVEGRQYHIGNPWAGHEPLPEDEQAVPGVEPAQLDALLAALDNPTGPLPSHGRRPNRFPWRELVELARETGLRKGELGRLEWTDIDQATRTIYVPSTRRRGRTKSRRMRVLPLSAKGLEVLARLGFQTSGPVFGKVPDPRRAMARAAKAAGLERAWLHLFRHLFASRLAERGAGRQELREAGGWTSSRMADRYTHARLGRLRELVEGGAGGESPSETTRAAPVAPEPP